MMLGSERMNRVGIFASISAHFSLWGSSIFKAAIRMLASSVMGLLRFMVPGPACFFKDCWVTLPFV